MPNLRALALEGPMGTILSAAFYGAPIWFEKARASRRIRSILQNIQRKLISALQGT